MKAFFMKLLKDKAKKKSSQSSSQSMFSLSPLFKYAVFGGGGFTFFILIVVVIIVAVFAPVFLAQEYFGSDDNKAYAYDYCGDSCGENESKFYSKLNEVRESYKSRGVTIDANLISGTVFYGSTLSSESFDPDDPDSDTLIDDSKIHVSDVKSLASNMVSGSSIDYNRYRSYLVNTYIPKRFSHLYNDDKGIEKIADEIMSYASYDNSRLASSGFIGINCTSITLKDDDGIKTLSLEDYVAGVVSGENDYGVEASKMQAIAARTNAVSHCNSVIDNSTNFQKYKSPSPSGIAAAEATKDLVLTYNGGLLKDMAFASYPRAFYNDPSGFPGYYEKGALCSDVVCSDKSDGRKWCRTTIYKLPDLESFTLDMPDKTLSGSYWNGLSLSNQEGHCYGVSQVATRYYEDELNYDYKKMIEVFFSDGVEVSSINSIRLGLISGGLYSTNAPIYNTSTDFFSHVDYRYYASTSVMPDPGNYGECPWYAKGRAIELIAYSNMSDDLKETLINSLRNTRGNGGDWYNNPSNELFVKTTDVYAARPGSIVSWSKIGGYGHVGIVEDVEYDENGRAKFITLSEGWNGTGNPGAAQYAFRKLGVEQFKTYNGSFIFNGYVYLLG